MIGVRFWFGRFGAGLAVGILLASCGSPQPVEQGAAEQGPEVMRAWRHLSCAPFYREDTNPAVEKRVLAMTKRHSKAGFRMIADMSAISNQYCGKPANSYLQYLDDDIEHDEGADPLRILANLAILVHESTHAFSFSAQFGRAGTYDEEASKKNGRPSFRSNLGSLTSVYLKGWGVRHISHTPTFPAREIVSYFDRDALRTNRFDLYIGKASPNHVTQVNGIYGLLDEFHAYYHGNATTPNIVQAYSREKRKLIVDAKIGSFTTVGFDDSFLAFPEFKLFILRYLQVAKEKHPEKYKQFLDNALLIEAFLRIHDQFQAVYQSYKSIHAGDIQPIQPVENDYMFRPDQEYGHELELPAMKAMMKELRRRLDETRAAAGKPGEESQQ